MSENITLNIFQRMLKATAEIDKVAKNLKVDISSRQSYKAVAEADVLEAVKPIEEKYGIYSYPYSREIIKDEVITNTTTYEGKTTEKCSLLMRIKTVYRFVNVDNPQEYIDITTYGDGVDTQDKAPGKAMTYADKYALLKGYKIQTGDDPDTEASKELKSSQNKPLTLKEALQLEVEVNGTKYRLGALNKTQLNWLIDKSSGITKEAIELVRREKFKKDLEEEQGDIPF